MTRLFYIATAVVIFLAGGITEYVVHPVERGLTALEQRNPIQTTTVSAENSTASAPKSEETPVSSSGPSSNTSSATPETTPAAETASTPGDVATDVQEGDSECAETPSPKANVAPTPPPLPAPESSQHAVVSKPATSAATSGDRHVASFATTETRASEPARPNASTSPAVAPTETTDDFQQALTRFHQALQDIRDQRQARGEEQ